MASCEAFQVTQLVAHGKSDRPLVVVGITHSQTCLVLRERLRAFREGGFRVVLISSPGELLDETAAEEGAEPIAIPMERGISPLSDLVALARLWWTLLKLRPEITEFGTPKAGLLGNIAALLCGVPRRVYLLRGLRLETASGLTRGILQLTEKLAAACAHVVVCNSESLMAQAAILRIADECKLRLIGDGSSNGVNVERFQPGPDRIRKRYGIPAGDPVIGFVGRLTRDKGVPELIAAFETMLVWVPNAWLLLVGWYDESEDALTADLRARIDAHPRMVRTGFVADTSPYYRALDMMVLPTWREGFPNVVLEAAASGVPVITTLATGSRDAVLSEVTGLLIPPGQPDAILEAMLKLLHDPELRRKMGTAARAWVLERFGNGRVLGMIVELYRGMVREGAAEAAAATTGAAAAAD